MQSTAKTPEGLYRHLDHSLNEPPASAAMRWLAAKTITSFERRLCGVVLAETLIRRRASASISRRQFVQDIGLKDSVWAGRKVQLSLVALERRGILHSKPGSAVGLNGRPAREWRLGYVDEVLATTAVAESSEGGFGNGNEVLATVSEKVLATPSEGVLATPVVALPLRNSPTSIPTATSAKSANDNKDDRW